MTSVSFKILDAAAILTVSYTRRGVQVKCSPDGGTTWYGMRVVRPVVVQGDKRMEFEALFYDPYYGDWGELSGNVRELSVNDGILRYRRLKRVMSGPIVPVPEEPWPHVFQVDNDLMTVQAFACACCTNLGYRVYRGQGPELQRAEVKWLTRNYCHDNVVCEIKLLKPSTTLENFSLWGRPLIWGRRVVRLDPRDFVFEQSDEVMVTRPKNG